MKFTCTVDIRKPVAQVVKLFDNPSHLREWQEGFVSLEGVSGKPGTKGAKSRISMKAGSNITVLTETILEKKLPSEMKVLYEHAHMDNTVTHRFLPVNDQTTRWTAEFEYIRFKEFVPRLFASVFPGIFRRQAQKWLDNFKRFAEKS